MISLSYLFEGLLTGFEHDYSSTTEPASKNFSLSKFYNKLRLKKLIKKQEK